MEKHFIADKSCKFYTRCAEYMEKRKEVFYKALKYLKQFKEDIDYDGFALLGNKFYLEDTEENRKLFGNQLAKNSTHENFIGLKKNGVVGRGWKETLPLKPMFCFEILNDGGGKFSERIFFFEDNLYIACRCTWDNDEVPEGFTEMKSSEYYALVERINEENLHVDLVR